MTAEVPECEAIEPPAPVSMMQLAEDLAYVTHLIGLHTELQATKHTVHTDGTLIKVEVEGSYYEARAWRHALAGRICESHIDLHGVRRQLVIGSRGIAVNVVEYPAVTE